MALTYVFSCCRISSYFNWRRGFRIRSNSLGRRLRKRGSFSLIVVFCHRVELLQSSRVLTFLTQGSPPRRRTLGFGGETPFRVLESLEADDGQRIGRKCVRGAAVTQGMPPVERSGLDPFWIRRRVHRLQRAGQLLDVRH